MHARHHTSAATHPTRKERAQNLAVSGVAAGVSLIFSGLAYILWGPTGVEAVHTWFTGSVIAGLMLVFLSLVSYFSYMETSDPAGYGHETLHLEPYDAWDQDRPSTQGDLVGPDANLR